MARDPLARSEQGVADSGSTALDEWAQWLMCGINGIVALRNVGTPVELGELRRTRDAMTNRGPDGAGEWLAADGTAALGHRRLAVIDPSDAAAQPMASADGRFLIVYNGEIYNYLSLRRDLERDGAVFRSASDTEVVLALFQRYGEAMLPKLRGMFALAIFDTWERRLLLARDPLGIKPLYYTTEGGLFRFASQVKALEAGGRISLAVDPAACVAFLLWGSIPEPMTLRRAVRAIPAGYSLAVTAGRVSEPVPFGRQEEADREVSPDVVEAVRSCIEAHLVADVPVAIFLSAGLDSAMVAAVAVRSLPDPPTTLTVRFEEFLGTPLDEGPLAAVTAARLGTRHVERVVGRTDFADLWPRALAAMDQPSIDGFNTYVIARVAHELGFKVVLSGLGGDELFGSYPSFRQVPTIQRIGRWVRHLAPVWPHLARALAPATPKLVGLAEFGGTLAGAYFLRRGLFLPRELPAVLGEELAREGLARYQPVAAIRHLAQARDPWRAVHQLESSHYLRHQLLRDADWAAMAHSVELRVPFVDADLQGAVARAGFEPCRSRGKAALAEALAPELPASILNRRKTGFAIPVMRWLRADEAKGRAGLDSRQLALRVLREFGVPLSLKATLEVEP